MLRQEFDFATRSPSTVAFDFSPQSNNLPPNPLTPLNLSRQVSTASERDAKRDGRQISTQSGKSVNADEPFFTPRQTEKELRELDLQLLQPDIQTQRGIS